MTDRYTVLIDGVTVSVELRVENGRIEATVDGRSYLIDTASIENGVCWFNWEQRSVEAIVAAVEDGYSVSINGYSVAVEFPDTRQALRRAVHQGVEGRMEVRAPMPGKIVRILAPEGSTVEANQGIVVVEAMKMQNEIKSPKRGRIAKLNVAEGGAVKSGDSVAVVE